MKPEETFKSESPLNLLGGDSDVAVDYIKRDHVFRLRLADGNDYLLQASDKEQMNNWVTSVKEAAKEEGAKS